MTDPLSYDELNDIWNRKFREKPPLLTLLERQNIEGTLAARPYEWWDEGTVDMSYEALDGTVYVHTISNLTGWRKWWSYFVSYPYLIWFNLKKWCRNER